MRVQASELNGRVSSRRQTCASLQSGDWEAVVEPGNTQEARLSQLSRTDNASYRQGPVVGICFAISGALGSFFICRHNTLRPPCWVTAVVERQITETDSRRSLGIV